MRWVLHSVPVEFEFIERKLYEVGKLTTVLSLCFVVRAAVVALLAYQSLTRMLQKVSGEPPGGAQGKGRDPGEAGSDSDGR